jgi:hypothetical protein
MQSRTTVSNCALSRAVIALTSALIVVGWTVPIAASSRVPSHVAAVTSDFVLLWNYQVDALDLHSARSGAFVQRLPFGRLLSSLTVYDSSTSSFWGVGADWQSQESFVWEWKPGMARVIHRPLLTKGLLSVTQSGNRRLVTYLNASEEPTIVQIGKNLTDLSLTTIPSYSSDGASCTFSGADAPEPYSSSYLLDHRDMTVLRKCPPEDSAACAFKHWREVRLPHGWLMCASDCLSCHEWNGEVWIQRSPLRTDLVDRLYSLKADPYRNDVVYAVGAQDSPIGQETLRLLVTKDRGASWRIVDTGCVPAGGLLGELFFTADDLFIPTETGDLHTLQLLQVSRDDKHAPRNLILPLKTPTDSR